MVVNDQHTWCTARLWWLGAARTCARLEKAEAAERSSGVTRRALHSASWWEEEG